MAEVTWWLDASALPDRFLWARLDVLADGSAVVLDLDGRYHRFADRASADLWLAEDEYESLTGLVAAVRSRRASAGRSRPQTGSWWP